MKDADTMPTDNPYDAIIEAEQSAAAASPGAAVNPYLQLLEDEEAQRRQRLLATTALAFDVNPDKYAEQRRLAQFLRVPTAAVEALPERFERAANAQQVESDTRTAPALHRSYTDADFARLARGDSGPLSLIETALQSFKRGVPALRQSGSGARELGAAVSGSFGYSGPAGTRFFSDAAKLSKQAAQGEADAAALKAANSVAGVLFHYPALQAQRTAEGVAQAAEGGGSLRALLFGAAPDK